VAIGEGKDFEVFAEVISEVFGLAGRLTSTDNEVAGSKSV